MGLLMCNEPQQNLCGLSELKKTKYLFGIGFCGFMVFGDSLSSVVLLFLSELPHKSAVNCKSARCLSALDTGELLAGAVGIIESALFLPVGFPRLIHMMMGQGSKKIEQ